MNAERRKRVGKLIALVSEARSLADELATEEAEAFENLPDNLTGGERGERMRDAIALLESTRDGLEDIESTLDDSDALGEN